MEQNYYLEVASPGMDRELVKPKHYQRYLGSEVEIRLYKGKDGTKNIQGVLHTMEGDSITAVSYTHLDVYKRQPICNHICCFF